MKTWEGTPTETADLSHTASQLLPTHSVGLLKPKTWRDLPFSISSGLQKFSSPTFGTESKMQLFHSKATAPLSLLLPQLRLISDVSVWIPSQEEQQSN